MPRIAASLAVLLTAVTCIGFNTARYPAVWQMVCGTEGLAQADPSDDPAAAPPSTAATQSESLAPSTAEAESAPAWQSDWQPNDEAADSTDRESTTVEPSAAYGSYEDGNSYQRSQDSSLQHSDESSYRYSDEGSYDSDGGRYDTNSASSPGYGRDEPAGSDDYDPRPGDDHESASHGDYDSWGNDENERGDRVAIRESWEQTASEPETNVSPSSFDPVAPQYRPTTRATSYQGYGEDASDADRTEACNDEANDGEDTVTGPTDEPVEAQPSARYASYALGTYDDSPEPSPGDTIVRPEMDEGGEVVPQSTLVPVKPATPGPDRDEPLAARPWDDRHSLENRAASAGSSKVIPLPPVDEVATVAACEPRPADAEDAVRIYPSTGVE